MKDSGELTLSEEAPYAAASLKTGLEQSAANIRNSRLQISAFSLRYFTFNDSD